MTDVGDRLRDVLRRRTVGAGSSIPPLSTVVDGARRRRRRSRALRTGASGAVVAITLTVVLIAANRSPSVRTAVDSIGESPNTTLPSTTSPALGTTAVSETATTFGLGRGQVNAVLDPLVLLDAQHLVWIATSSNGERRVLVSTDGGAQWKATLQVPTDQYGSVVGRGSVVWVRGYSMAWSSSDFGLTWHQEALPSDGLALVRVAPNGVIGLTPKGELMQRIGDQPWSSLPQAEPYVDVCPTAAGAYVGVGESGVWTSIDTHDWFQATAVAGSYAKTFLCLPDRLVAVASSGGMGHISGQAWVSRDGAGWTDVTPPPYDPPDPNNPSMRTTTGYLPVAAPTDGSIWYHAYSILEAQNASFDFAVSQDEGKSKTTITLAPPKPPDGTYLGGPLGFAALDARTAWVVLNESSPSKSVDILYVTHDQGRTWQPMPSDSVT